MSVCLPRSVVAALWVGCADPHKAWFARAADAVTGSDEPLSQPGQQPLPLVLEHLASRRGTTFAALPVPHEPVGIDGPASEAAMDAGECVVVVSDGEGVVAIPDVVAFGSALEPGAIVGWQVHETRVQVPPVALSQARRSLAEALVIAVDALESMDVARWRPDAAEDIAMLASDAIPPAIAPVLPPDLDPRRADLLVRAARLEAITDLAMADDGAAVTMWAADQRHAALRHVAGASRHAMQAAATFPPPR